MASSSSPTALVLTGATIIDAARDEPLHGQVLWIEGERIKAICAEADLPGDLVATRLDCHGRFVIPGLIDANTHLMGDIRLENLIRFEDRYETIILEAAQITLKGGLTTVFDTWGPRQALINARDAIAQGAAGSRIYCAGNILGLDGPISRDFYANADAVSAPLAERINATWVENSGPALSWMTASEVAREVDAYIDRGIDFVKYASSEHRWGDPSTFLLFSPRIQKAIVAATHARGLTAQAHATSVESLHAALEAGCDLIQHCNITGPTPIPDDTIELFVESGAGAVIFPLTQRRFDWVMDNCRLDAPYFQTSDLNVRRLMEAGAKLLLSTDSMMLAPEGRDDPLWSNFWTGHGEDNLGEFGRGHFVWMKAMEEKGQRAIDILRGATRNIAEAYGLGSELGTLEPGKLADMLVLDQDPLASSAHYRTIRHVIKGGRIIDVAALPEHPLQSLPLAAPTPAVEAYRRHRTIGRSSLPMCGCGPRH